VTSFYLGIAVFLLLNLGGGLVRILRGPAPADRMLAAQLFGSTGVAILLMLAAATETRALRDVALAFALLGPANAVVFVSWTRRRGGEERRAS
jgi:multicomponent Na+:H+ antiporter subunit F